MAEIKDTATLNAEITRLRNEIGNKKKLLKDDVAACRELLSFPGIIASAYKSFSGRGAEQQEKKSFTGDLIKTGLSLLIGKFLIAAGEKAEQKVYDTVESGIDKIKGFWERKFKKSKQV
jgi:hypothetical protein